MKRNLMPFDLANLPSDEEAIESYLRQVMKEGGAAKVARARLHIEKAQARTALVNSVIAAPMSLATPSPAPGAVSPRRCCG